MVADQPVESRDLAAVAQQEDGRDAHDAVSRNGVGVSVDIDPVASEVVGVGGAEALQAWLKGAARRSTGLPEVQKDEPSGSDSVV